MTYHPPSAVEGAEAQRGPGAYLKLISIDPVTLSLPRSLLSLLLLVCTRVLPP